MGQPNVAGSSLPPQSAPVQKLSSRQLLILQLIRRGYTAAEIASLLGPTSSIADVEAAAMEAASALGATCVEEAIAEAVKRGLIV